MTNPADFDDLTAEASDLSDAITDLCRAWAARHLEAGRPTDAVMALTSGALVFSLAECVGQFVTANSRAAWAAAMSADTARMSDELEQQREKSH